MRNWIDLVEAVDDTLIYHGTAFGPEILADGLIRAHFIPKAGIEGVCVTRSFYFARQFSMWAILGLDRNVIAQTHRLIPRAETGAYDLANQHGDYRIEAEELIPGSLDLKSLRAIWVCGHEDPNEVADLISHPLFRGFYSQP